MLSVPVGPQADRSICKFVLFLPAYLFCNFLCSCHKNVSTTQIYTHVTNTQLRDVHKASHSGNK